MAIQIFGSSKSFDTKKALRWFAERRIPVQEVSLKDKGISAGELESVISCLAKTCGSRMAAVEELIDTTAKDYAIIAYLEDSAKPQKLLDNPLLHQGTHDGLGLFLCPQLLAEIKVNRYSYTMTLGSFASQLCQLSSLVRNGRSDT